MNISRRKGKLGEPPPCIITCTHSPIAVIGSNGITAENNNNNNNNNNENKQFPSELVYNRDFTHHSIRIRNYRMKHLYCTTLGDMNNHSVRVGEKCKKFEMDKGKMK